MKKRAWKRFLILAAVFAFVAVGMNSCVILPGRAFPKSSGTVKLEGLKGPVEILRDKYGIPHIYARNTEDLFFANGYVHAQDRFWQMEFSRRVGAGRLAELFGNDLLETDIFLRTLGVYRVAQEEYKVLDVESRKFLDSYAAGVNAYIRDKKPGKISLEYSFLKLIGTDFEIDDWVPADSIVWAKMMAWNLSANMNVERLLLFLLRTAGMDGTAGFFAPYREDMPVIISDEELGFSTVQAPDGAGDDQLSSPVPPIYLGKGNSLGSNSWVISGDLTESGAPILANDTHLGVQMPSVFYELGLHIVDQEGQPVTSGGDDIQVRGFSFPGVPGVIIGHNGHIAWGITDFGDDVQDLYFERINPLNPNQYQVNGEWRDMELTHERIDIQGESDPFVLVVRNTRHGPIISDRGGNRALESYSFSSDREFPENLELTSISLKWTALMPGMMLKSMFDLDRAQNFEEFLKALSNWTVPIQSIVYADTEGNIGYKSPGVVPIRKKSKGRIPVPGWTDEYEWIGFVPYDDLPSVLNPKKGYIVAANQPVTGPNYPYYLGIDASYGYRARRIVEMIEIDEDGITIDDAKAMQGDSLDLAALEIVKYLEGLDLTKETVSEYLKEKEPGIKKKQKKKAELDSQVEDALDDAMQSLLDWDGYLNIDSSPAAIYGFFFFELSEAVFSDQYPDVEWLAVSHDRIQNALYYLLEDPNNAWWDDVRTPDVHETRDDILVRAFRKAVRTGIEELGEKLEKWEWGAVHQTEFRNATLGESGIGFIENIFNRGPFSVPGGSTTVFQTNWLRDEPFKVYWSAASREIIDMGDLSSGLMMLAPGQSGHAKHRHYDDFIDPWRNIEYHPNLWFRKDVEANNRSRLTLEPSGL